MPQLSQSPQKQHLTYLSLSLGNAVDATLISLALAHFSPCWSLAVVFYLQLRVPPPLPQLGVPPPPSHLWIPPPLEAVGGVLCCFWDADVPSLVPPFFYALFPLLLFSSLLPVEPNCSTHLLLTHRD